MGEVNQQAKAIFTVDVEEWFHAAVIEKYIPRNQWSNQTSRLEYSIQLLLDLLDEHQATATFFCLSNLLPQFAPLIKEIHTRGHEIASHTVSHRNLGSLSTQDLHTELGESKNSFEALLGVEIFGFRAPNFSITEEALFCLQSLGYRYDSSVFDVKWHPAYGKLSPNLVQEGQSYEIIPGLLEVPLSILPLGLVRLPWSGGGYVRQIPTSLFELGVKHLYRRGYYHFYIHPWEVDKNHPKVEKMHPLDSIRHYRNISAMPHRLDKMLSTMKFVKISRYLGL